MTTKTKKFLSLFLASTMSLTLLASCSSSEEPTQTTTPSASQDSGTDSGSGNIFDNTDGNNVAEAGNIEVADIRDYEYTDNFILEYPSFVEGMDPIVLDSVPETVVCLTTAPVLALYEMGVNVVIVPSTSVIDYPEDLRANAEIVTAVTSDDFDIENVIGKNPDLVFIPSSAYDKYGSFLEDAGIPTYIVSTAMLVADHYEIIKGETDVFTRAFVKDEASEAKAREILGRFDDLDAKIEEATKVLTGKTYLSAMANPNGFFVQQDTSTLPGVLNKFGMKNCYDAKMGEATAPIDLETVVGLENDLQVFVYTTMDPDVAKESVLATVANQQELWDTVKAIQDDNVLYLTTNYWVFGGIQILDSIDSLIDMLMEMFG